MYDSTGAEHRLFLNANDTTQFRTMDGSGFQWNVGASDVDYTGDVGTVATLLTPAGLSYSNQGVYFRPTTVSDGDNNSLTFQAGELYVDSSDPYVSDSVGRIVPNATSTSTSVCPNLNEPFQSANSAAQWTVPGPNGSVTYTICYELIQVRTNFFGGDSYCNPSGDLSEICYLEYAQQEGVIQSVILPNGTYYGFIYDAADPANNNSYALGTITKIILPTGGSISYGYSMFEACDGVGEAVFNPGISSRTVSDLNGHQYSWTYSIDRYQGSIATDPDLNDTVYKYDGTAPGNPCSQHETERVYYQGSSSSGGTILKDIKKQYYTVTAPGVVYSPIVEVMSDLPRTITASNSDATETIQSLDYTNQSFSTFARACLAEYYPCVNGNHVTASLVVSAPIGMQTSETITNEGGTTLRSTATSYAWQAGSSNYSNYLSNNFLASPTLVQTSDASALKSQTTTAYDESAYVTNQSVYAGHPTTFTRTNDHGSDVVTRTHWNAYGMPDYIKDGNQITSHTYIYEPSQHLFVKTDQDALGNDTTMVSDPATGMPTSVTDVNNETTGYTYDSMGRVINIAYPDSGSTQYNYHSDPTPPQLTISKATGTAAGLLATTIKFDGLGRAIHGSIDSAPGGAIIVDRTLNFADAPLSVSNPYLSSGSSSGYTTYKYDALGRISLMCNPDNGNGAGTCTAGSSYQSWNYGGSTTTFKDELRRAWVRTNDALGRLTQVVEPNGAATYYDYDALGNLTCGAQDGNSGGTFTSCAAAPASWRPRTFTYDSLSRLVTANNPETGTVCYGTLNGGSCTEGYDGNGNLKYKTDARGIVTGYSYDLLNQLTSKTYTFTTDASSTIQALAAATPSNCYQYGTATNGVERLSLEFTTRNGCVQPPSSDYLSKRVVGAYDAMGRVSSEQQCVWGQGAYCTSASVPAQPPQNCSILTTAAGLQYCYDLAGNLLANSFGVTTAAAGSYPQAASNFSQTFDGVGRLATVSSSWNDVTHPAQVFAATGTNGYTSSNALSNWLLGGSLYSARAFDVRNRVCKQQSSLQAFPTLQCP